MGGYPPLQKSFGGRNFLPIRIPAIHIHGAPAVSAVCHSTVFWRGYRRLRRIAPAPLLPIAGSAAVWIDTASCLPSRI